MKTFGGRPVERRREFPPSSLMSLIYKGYLAWPAKTMAYSSGRTLSWGEAYTRAYSLCCFFRMECGLVPGSRVILSAPNYVEFPIVLAALQTVGADVCMVSATAGRNDFQHAIDLLSPSLVAVSRAEHIADVRSIDPDMPLYTFRPVDQADGSTEAVPDLEAAARRYFGREGLDIDWDCSIDSAILLFSSGSTGAPKAIANRSSSFLRNAGQLDRHLQITGDDVVYVPVPFAHVYGIVGMYATLRAGASLSTAEKYRPESSLALQADTRVTIYLGVTTMFLREMRLNGDRSWSLPCLTRGMIAGAPCPESALRDYEEMFGCELVQSYGMTETAATLTVSDFSDSVAERAESVGKPIKDVQIRIDPANGEILVKTPSLMIGIVRDGSYELVDVDEDGWLHTGDVGSFDDAGNLRITGRIKDIIIRGGINIFPAEVENVYQAHPSIDACCLVGYPDPELGERSCLCAVMKPGAEESSRELRLFAKGKLEKCMYPDTVLRMDDLPKLANGKIDKKTLRKYAAEKLDPSRRFAASNR